MFRENQVAYKTETKEWKCNRQHWKSNSNLELMLESHLTPNLRAVKGKADKTRKKQMKKQ